MAADYTRRADVINRGFFGYNSQHAVDHVLPTLFPQLPLLADDDDDDERLLFCTVYFGANDATIPGSRQSIPESQFQTNLNTIITTIRQRSQQPQQQQPNLVVPIILMTPPPLDGETWANFKGLANRSNKQHQLYGNLVKDVAKQHPSCSVLDVWTLLEGDKSVDIYRKYLTDGLHLNEAGNKKLYQGFCELLETEYPDLLPQQEGSPTGIPLEGPLWDELC